MTASWPAVALGDISSIAYGYTESASIDAIGPKFLRITDIQDDNVNWVAVPYCPIEPADLRKHRLLDGDIVFARTGATTGKSFLVRDPPEAVPASYLIRLRPTDPTVIPEFLALFFQTGGYWRSIREGTSGSAQGGFNASKLAALELPLPPLDEQRRIVAVLDEAFAAIASATANAEKNVANAQELFDASVPRIMAAVCGDVKGGPLGEIGGRVFTGPFGSLLHKHDYEVGGIPLVNPSHIDNGRIVPSNEKSVGSETAERLSSYRMKVGDIVFGRRGEMGRCAVVTALEQGFLCGTGSFFIRPFGQADPHYLAQLLRSASYRKKLEALAGGATMPNLSNTALSELWIELPDYPTQQALVRKIDGLREQADSIVNLTTRKIVELSALKESLLHRAFSGQLTEREPLAA